MAKRMFSTKITSSSQFLMMAQSAQNLYFHLGMNADDDGFVEHFTIMRMTESKPDDLNVLQVRKFVKVFDDRVLIIRDWKINNNIRSDRYTPSKYLQIYKNELKLIAKESQKAGIPNDNQMVDVVQSSIDKSSIDKIRLDKDTNTILATSKDVAVKEPDLINLLIDKFKEINPSYKNFFANKTQRGCLGRLVEQFGTEHIGRVIDMLPSIQGVPYAPTITTPKELEDKIAALKSFIQKEQVKNNKSFILSIKDLKEHKV